MKYKLLLGAYIDSINAQDINCFNIAKYIDKNKYEVHAFCHSDSVDIQGVICHKVSNNRLLKNVQKLLKMFAIKADIYYLPRVEKVDMLFAHITKRRIVSSIEIQTVYEKPAYDRFFNRDINGYFCISSFLNNLNYKYWKKNVPVIYLGINDRGTPIVHQNIKKIIWVGSIVNRKRPELFLDIAKSFPDLEFCMIGDGDQLPIVRQKASDMKISNIIFTGRLSNEATLLKLQDSDLLCITSKEEGLPKVVLEAASVGVPTIYINEMYDVDYIQNGVNGFGVINIFEMKEKIDLLICNAQIYKEMSSEVGKLALKYSWPSLMAEYEGFFEKWCIRGDRDDEEYNSQRTGKDNY